MKRLTCISSAIGAVLFSSFSGVVVLRKGERVVRPFDPAEVA
jgi:hypothetical protein